MKKYFMLLPFFTLLVACTDTVTTEPIPASQIEEDVEQATVETAVQTQAIVDRLSEQQADSITESLIRSLKDQTMQAVDQNETISAEELKEVWSPYATTNFIEESFSYADQYENCGDDYCGVLYGLPPSFHLGWEKQFSIDDQQFLAAGLFPNMSDMMYNHANFIEIDVINIDNEWKINHVSFTEQDINLQENEVIRFLKTIYDMTIDDFYAGTIYIENQPETVYIFTEPEWGETQYLFARTGVMHASTWYEE